MREDMEKYGNKKIEKREQVFFLAPIIENESKKMTLCMLNLLKTATPLHRTFDFIWADRIILAFFDTPISV